VTDQEECLTMRIAMIGLRGIPHTYGGGEEFVLHVAPRLVERGHEVIVYCRSRYYADRAPMWRGVRRVFFPAPEHKSLGQFVHAALATVDAAVRRPDIIYVHTLPSAPHTILPWLLRQPVIVNVNGMDWARAKWGPAGKAYFRAATRITLRTATAIVNDSQAMRRYYLDRYGRDSYFIAYGAEIRNSTHPETLAQYGVRPRGYYLIASRLVPENNADLIVHAFTRTNSQRQLLVAGAANYRSKWLAELLETKDPRVRFLGHVADPDHIKELHCNCYCYLHGHSLGGTNPALLKALGCGNAILALDTPFNREVLVNSEGVAYGLLFPKDVAALADTIAALDRDERRAAELRARAPDRIRQAYTWDFIADEYERMFREVLEKAGQARRCRSAPYLG
jgi:glycosyltransferase involved in cell wall biosynthesis